ncbi:hypothetical protein HPP92_000705 [Vanilla planifolia]|uniref:Uncharacterized protein n=1 Tax=Vanilla planifolia TaxID=51239 RepID=A0A835VKV7_VANPL|nr:hypothetical protein HPP92_000828 [Vanilla planifolia]KAG0500633.1 hypothetical protein HPP92_000705 [Vanilla planifolia]
MKARVVVFPIRGRNWCFSRSADPSAGPDASSPPQKLRDLITNITSSRRSAPENAEIVVDFVSDKMNRAWATLEKAPEGTFKSKLHSLGLRLLSRVKPSEVFLKSVSKDVTQVEIAYPVGLEPRLVRRRLRHIAMRGSTIHKKRLYGSVSLLPLTSFLTVLPLPNVPFFWILFRAYSNWKAMKGSERLLPLVSDCWGSNDESMHRVNATSWVLEPSEELHKVLTEWKSGGVRDCTISSICSTYNLDKNQVLKYKESL